MSGPAVIARVALGRARQHVTRLYGRVAPSGTILAYHRVAELARDPQALAVAPGRFREQLAVLCERGRPLSLAELHARLRDGSLPDGAFALTFDDGYADNLVHALPALEEFGVPATIFVTSGALGRDQPFWWDELADAILDAPVPSELSLRVASQPRAWSVTVAPSFERGWSVLDDAPAGSREAVYAELAHALTFVSNAVRDDVLEQLWAWRGERGASVVDRGLSEAELARLAGHELIEIGAHTVSHPVLGRLAEDEQRRELAASRERLEQITSRPVESVSYPFGNWRHFTATTTRIAAQVGYRRGCANVAAPATRLASSWALPRMLVRDWDGDAFARRFLGAVQERPA